MCQLTHQHSWFDWLIIDDITIAATAGRMTGMEIIINRRGPLHTNLRRQMGIGAHYPGFGAPVYGCVEMDDLACGMNSCVGATGAADRHLLVCDT